MFKESLVKYVSRQRPPSGRSTRPNSRADPFFTSRSKNQNVPITFSALINDTTGTLIASNYVDPATKIAVIFGTGCNAAYMETVENIPKMKGLGLPDKQEMAINCEWGAFDSFEHVYLSKFRIRG